MTEIELRFTERNARLILEGRKRATARRERHGERGDTFTVGTKRYVIAGVHQMQLRQVFDLYYPEEGYDSPADAQEAWMAAYNLLHIEDLNHMVYLHTFYELPPQTPG
jgi:hypothetical protein